MLQTGQGPGLALESGDTLRIAAHLGGENLDRHFPVELGVVRAVDLAHATLAELGDDFIVGEGLSDQLMVSHAKNDVRTEVPENNVIGEDNPRPPGGYRRSARSGNGGESGLI